MVSCREKVPVQLSEINLSSTNGKTVNLGEVARQNNLVLIFLSPDCPLCISYTKTINVLSEKYRNNSVKFIPVYAGPFYSENEIRDFQKAYNFEMPGLLDPKFQLVKMMDATITPEAVLLNTNGNKVYSGAIDNWMYETGKKRQVITEAYLDTAISQLLKGDIPNPAEITPVGCFIEK
jgi:peroxiredoxin